MKKFVFILSLLLTLQSYAQNPWERISPNPIESSLYEITRIPGTDRMMAVGSGASLMYTNDMGENWNINYKPAGIPRTTRLNAIHFVNSTLGFVAGTNSTLLKTTDGGITWSNVSPSGNSEFFDVFFLSEYVGFITKNYTVMRTTDGCQTWDSTFLESSVKLTNLHFINDTSGFVLPKGSPFYYGTKNGGDTWRQVDILPVIEDVELHALLFLNESTGFISGVKYTISSSTQYILKTYDGGITWSQVYTDPFNYVHDIYFYDSDTGFAVGPRIMYDNIILKTTDSGESWQVCEMPFSNRSLNSLTFSDNGIGICVGRYGQIFSSYNWGLNWVKTDDHFAPLSSINVSQTIGDSVVYIGTSYYGGGVPSGGIFKSIDAGYTWNRVFYNIPINSIHFVTPAYGLACGTAFGEVYKTVDGGQLWETTEIDYFNLETECVYFINEQIGFVGGYGDESGLYKTIDGGDSWYIPDSVHPINGIGDIAFSNDSIGYAITLWDGLMYTTVDQGETWEMKEIFIYNEFERIKFFNNNLGFIIGWNKIYKTIDGGSNWYEVPSGLGGYPYFNDIDFPTDDIGYITLSGNEITVIKTTDGGETWFPLEFPCTATPTSVGFFSEDQGLVMGSGGIIFCTYSGGIVSVPENPDINTNEPNLHCYPNPVKDVISTDLRLVNNTYPEKLIFFDIFGRRITEIENHEKNDNVKLNVSHWENGIYFIISVSGGEITDKGKFIKIE